MQENVWPGLQKIPLNGINLLKFTEIQGKEFKWIPLYVIIIIKSIAMVIMTHIFIIHQSML